MDHAGVEVYACVSHEPSCAAEFQPLLASDASSGFPMTMREAGMPYDTISPTDVPGKYVQSDAEFMNRPCCVV